MPHVNTSNHAPYFSIIILFSHEVFGHFSISVVALRAYALNKWIMMNLAKVSPATLTFKSDKIQLIAGNHVTRAAMLVVKTIKNFFAEFA